MTPKEIKTKRICNERLCCEPATYSYSGDCDYRGYHYNYCEKHIKTVLDGNEVVHRCTTCGAVNVVLYEVLYSNSYAQYCDKCFLQYYTKLI